MRNHWKKLVILALITAPFLRADGPVKKPATVDFNGAIEKAAEWTPEAIAKEFAADLKEVSYTIKGKPGKARAVLLAKLIAAAKPKLNPKQKNHHLAFCVLVQGADGYAASFSMGELLPEFGGAEVYLALDRDGGPLPASELPVSLLVLGDKKPSRWVHGIVTISVVDGLAAATNLSQDVKPAQESSAESTAKKKEAVSNQGIRVNLEGAGQDIRLPFRENMSVLDALAEVGGLPSYADRAKIWLVYPDGKRLQFDWNALVEKADFSTNHLLKQDVQILIKSVPGKQLLKSAESPKLKMEEIYVVKPYDVLGIWIPGLLGDKEAQPPVHASGPTQPGRSPGIGYPIRVGEDGTISLPDLPLMKVGGNSLKQIEGGIRAALKVLPLPAQQQLKAGKDRVLVSLLKGNRGKDYIYVISDAGIYGADIFRLPFEEGWTVLDAIPQIGGLPPHNSAGLWLLRLGNERKPIGWQDIVQRGDVSTNYPLKPGDCIFLEANPELQKEKLVPANPWNAPKTSITTF